MLLGVAEVLAIDRSAVPELEPHDWEEEPIQQEKLGSKLDVVDDLGVVTEALHTVIVPPGFDRERHHLSSVQKMAAVVGEFMVGEPILPFLLDDAEDGDLEVDVAIGLVSLIGMDQINAHPRRGQHQEEVVVKASEDLAGFAFHRGMDQEAHTFPNRRNAQKLLILWKKLGIRRPAVAALLKLVKVVKASGGQGKNGNIGGIERVQQLSARSNPGFGTRRLNARKGSV